MKVRMVGVIIAATLLAALVPISGAQAATVYSTGFTRVETWYSTPLKRCFQATLTGTLKATAWHVGAGRSTGFYFGKPEIVSPVLRVKSYATSRGQPTRRPTIRARTPPATPALMCTTVPPA